MIWETTFKTTTTVTTKLHDAERRLKAPLYDILTRWVIDEKISMADMMRKLDISHGIIDRLLIHFNLKSAHDLNVNNRKKLKPTF